MIKCYVFLFFVGLRFCCVMIVLKNSGCLHQPLLYSFRVVLIWMVSDQVQLVLVLVRWFRMDGFGWLWMVSSGCEQFLVVSDGLGQFAVLVDTLSLRGFINFSFYSRLDYFKVLCYLQFLKNTKYVRIVLNHNNRIVITLRIIYFILLSTML